MAVADWNSGKSIQWCNMTSAFQTWPIVVKAGDECGEERRGEERAVVEWMLLVESIVESQRGLSWMITVWTTGTRTRTGREGLGLRCY